MHNLNCGRVRADLRQALRMRTRAFLEANVVGREICSVDELRVILEVVAASYACHMDQQRAAAWLQDLSRRIESQEFFI